MPESTVASPPTRVSPSDLLRSTRLIAVLRAPAASAYSAVVDVLVKAGIRSIELTLTTPGTFDALGALIADFGDRSEIGLGTVLTAEEAERAFDAGASYLVTPTVRPEVIAVALRWGRPVYAGALTPTEVHTNWSTGASAVKIFPASLVSPSYLAALRGPLPEVLLLPSGGVTLDAAPAWLRAGALAVSLGGELVGDALIGGDLDALAARACHVRLLVDELARPSS